VLVDQEAHRAATQAVETSASPRWHASPSEEGK
jgi:hypothetical protein